jgi:hypothetical protein
MLLKASISQSHFRKASKRKIQFLSSINPGKFLVPKVLDFNPFGVLTPNKKVIPQISTVYVH